jgi:hypothetical protein
MNDGEINVLHQLREYWTKITIEVWVSNIEIVHQF